MSGSGTTSFPERASGYLSSARPSVRPFTGCEYFTAMLGRAIAATKDGDYGISAALVLRYPDVELISLGRNTLISRHDPLGHAETNAIRQLQDFLSLPSTARVRNASPWADPASAAESSGDIFVRPGPASMQEASAWSPASPATDCQSILYTTLEPCPMCTAAILNSRIGKVVIAAPDEEGGALAPERLRRLPPIWPKLAASQGLRIAFTSEDVEGDPDTYVPGALSGLLVQAFLETKEARDARLEKGILFRSDTHAGLQGLLSATSQIHD